MALSNGRQESVKTREIMELKMPEIPSSTFLAGAQVPVRVNVTCGPAVERVLLTGLHAVADIKCECCETILGWKYEHAFESSQKYKEGKFIIELAHMIKDNGWE
ncbi:protein yippee-like [Elysia marginata]|uniref:Protein yippee-like n=1 Tax=Elysia marginata TaxID=1093978 RepID=A0AAV4G2H5_9GAST|nr:protein yippee-like [Elysia marginata]